MSMVRKISPLRLILPYYHLVTDQQPSHIRHLYSPRTIAEFQEDLDFLLMHYQPIQIDELMRLAKSGVQPAKPSFLLSFDDGLREFGEIIAPILRKRALPAICFLNSAFVDNKDLFFRYKVSLLIDHFEKNPSLIDQGEVRNWLVEHVTSGRDLRDYFLEIQYCDKAMIDELAGLVRLDFNQFLKEKKPYLTSPEIMTLAEDGFYFGAHSIDHPEYRFLEEKEQMRQTTESVGFVVERFSANPRFFSFPFTDYGVSGQFLHEIHEERIVDLSFGSSGMKLDSISGHLQRIPMEMQGLSARKLIKTEVLYSLARAVFGKNRISRK